MNERREAVDDSGGCSCLGIVLFVLVMWALLFGLPVNGKTLDIDLLPPAIRYQ